MSKKTIQILFFAVCTAIFLGLLFFIFKPYFGVIFMAGVFAVVFYPLYEELLERFRGRSGLASFFATFLILIFIIIPLVMLSAALLKEAIHLYDVIALGGGSQGVVPLIENLANKLNSLLPAGTGYKIDLASYARNLLNWVIGNVDSFFLRIFGGLLDFILMLLALYYLFIYGKKIKETLKSWNPLPDQYADEFVETLRTSVDAVFRGRILISIVQGIFVGLGFLFFGVGSPVLWGFVGAIASLVPVLGTSLVILPAVAFLYFTGSLGASLGLLLWGTLAVGLIDNFLSAVFLKGKIKVHPLIVLFSILGGVEVFGAIGFLVGPVIVSTFLAIIKMYPFIFNRNSSDLNSH